MTPTEFRDKVVMVLEEGFRLMLVLLVAIAIYLIFIGFAMAIECKERPDSKSYWSYRIIDGERCWYRGEGRKPKSSLHWSDDEPKSKKIKGDPVFQIRAEEEPVELQAVTWNMRRPFDQAAPIIPPLNLAVPDDPDVWPDLSEFERRFVGVQP